ncbi:MAG: hypothetical protein DRI95_14980 [Bacteroidetes bacterium]|nr:MAG: hypothetical protein DRI95_14980 [Bacteroidota bacterium]
MEFTPAILVITGYNMELLIKGSVYWSEPDEDKDHFFDRVRAIIRKEDDSFLHIEKIINNNK